MCFIIIFIIKWYVKMRFHPHIPGNSPVVLIHVLQRQSRNRQLLQPDGIKHFTGSSEQNHTAVTLEGYLRLLDIALIWCGYLKNSILFIFLRHKCHTQSYNFFALIKSVSMDVEKGISLTLSGNVTWCSHYREQYGVSSENWKQLPYDTVIPLLGKPPVKTVVWKDICTPMFIEVLFTKAKTEGI